MQGSIIHMHQPRERITTKIASNFLEKEKNLLANNIYGVDHFNLSQDTVSTFAQK